MEPRGPYNGNGSLSDRVLSFSKVIDLWSVGVTGVMSSVFSGNRVLGQ